MKIAYITCATAPYRKIQMEKFAELDKVSNINIYYTIDNYNLMNWNIDESRNDKIKEFTLKKLFTYKNIRFCKGLLKIVKENDFILIGGYNENSYWIVAMLCKKFGKPYAIIFDGINPKKCGVDEEGIRANIKKYMIKNSCAIFANGKVSELYIKKFGFDTKIYNQYLTIDTDKIKELSNNKLMFRNELRKKYNISEDDLIVQYSGRMLERKNVNDIVRAISKIEKTNGKIILFITGGGIEQENIKKLSLDLGVEVIITGFLSNQEDLFKFYFMTDLLVLPSSDEPWGLVINEALSAGLPVIVSDQCGCSLDLVRDGENGFLFETKNVDMLAEKINYFYINRNEITNMGNKSKRIIEQWNFDNCKKSFIRMTNDVLSNK